MGPGPETLVLASKQAPHTTEMVVPGAFLVVDRTPGTARKAGCGVQVLPA